MQRNTNVGLEENTEWSDWKRGSGKRRSLKSMESEDLKNVFLNIEHTSLIVLDIITCLAYVGL